MTDGKNGITPELPSDGDPIGQRYVRDSEGRVVLDRRRSSTLLARLLVGGLLLGLTLVMIFVIAVLVKQGNTQDQQDSQQESLKRTQRQQEHDASVALYQFRESQRAGCEGGNALRAGLRSMVKGQIEQTRRSDPSLFPDIPPEVFARLVRDQIERLQRLNRKKFDNVNCKARYPRLDNPDTKANEAGT